MPDYSNLKCVPAFSYLSPNTEQIPVVTDIRNLLRHSPNGSEPPQKCPSHFYQYHQHLQYQPQSSPKDGSWTSSPETSSNRKLTANDPSLEKVPGSKSSMFSFNFLHKSKDPAAQKLGDKDKAKRERIKDKKLPSSEIECRLIENYLSNPQRSKKNGLTLQQQYFQSQQQKLQAQRQKSAASRRILESHSYQNVSDEDRQRSQATTKVKDAERTQQQPQMFRRFGDTNLLSARNSPSRKELGTGAGDGHSEEPGGFRPHITSFADYANRSDISKYLNIDVKSGSHSSAYSSGSNMSPPSQGNKIRHLGSSKKSPLNRSSPSLLHHHDLSSSSSLLSDKSSCSSSSTDQRSYILGEPQPHEYGSYLGPFNFRQLLRPTQGPTESLRKRKGVTTNSPPPPQKGKSFI